MNPILRLRREQGLTQQTLAARAGTSQATIAAYESGVKSPTFRTVQRMAGSLGLEAVIDFVPEMTYADRRSLAFHEAIAMMLRLDSKAVVAKAKRHLARLKTLHPHAHALLDHWSIWLRLPVDDLIARMTDPEPFAREMRQVSPFAGVLDARQRARLLRTVRREHRG
jgi:transcriptional regulator with XRE-family HTH domain